jgi:hypothetical protein
LIDFLFKIAETIPFADGCTSSKQMGRTMYFQAFEMQNYIGAQKLLIQYWHQHQLIEK